MANTLNKQRGAIGLMAVGTLLLALMFLALALDSGRLYLEQRKLQRVADMAALEAASRGGVCTDAGPSAQLYALENARLRNGFEPSAARTLLVDCGTTQIQGQRKVFVVNPAAGTIRVQAKEQVPASLILGGIWGSTVQLTAEAAATTDVPVGMLAIRSTLLTLNTEQSALLNPLIGGLLGGNINLSAVSWEGIAGADLQLLSFLDVLATDLNLSVGDYEQVLNTGVGLGRLLNVAADALVQGGTAATDVAVLGLRALALQIPTASPLLRLSDILAVQTGTLEAGADIGLNALQLVTALAQLSNSANAVVAQIPLDVPGLVGGVIQIQVTEPPQISAIGNLEKARLNPLGVDSRIYVRTAQVRTLVSLELPLLGTLNTTVNGLLSALPALTGTVGSVLDLNLFGLLGNLLGSVLCVGSLCPEYKVSAIELLSNGRLDLNIDLGGAESYVTDYDCSNTAQPSMTVAGRNALANVRLGQLGETITDAQAKVFNPNQLPPEVKSLSLVKLGYKVTRPKACVLIVGCGPYEWKTENNSWLANEQREQAHLFTDVALGVKIDTPVVGSGSQYGSLLLTDVPHLAEPIKYYSMGPLGAGDNIVSSLSSTLSGVEVKAERTANSSLVGNIVAGVVDLAGSLINSLQGLLNGLLSPLLDPLLNQVLKLLGVDLADAEVGAKMTCGFGARLVL